MTIFNELGIKDRDERLEFCAAAGHPVTSSKELTVAQISHIIDVGQGCIDGSWVLTIVGDGPITLTPADNEPPLEDEQP
jgi:hypothetical protein